MPLVLADYDTPAPDPAREVDAFREQWKVVRRLARHLSISAEGVVARDGDPDFRKVALAYHREFCEVWLAVQGLIALAVKLSPEARAIVERGTGPLFEADGALTPLWRKLWLDDPRIAEAARVRRVSDTRF